MTNPTINQVNEQVEKVFGGPARAFASLTVNHVEALMNSQVEATKAYTDLGIKQLRTALEIKSPQDVQGYIQGQQEVAKELGERVKGDAEKVLELNRKYAEEAQKLTKQNVEAVSEEAQQVTQEQAKAASKPAKSQ